MGPQLLSKVCHLLTTDTYCQAWWICFSFDLGSFFFLIFLHSGWVISGFLSRLWSGAPHPFELCFLVLSASGFSSRHFLLSESCVISQAGTAMISCPMDEVGLPGGGTPHKLRGDQPFFMTFFLWSEGMGWNIPLNISAPPTRIYVLHDGKEGEMEWEGMAARREASQAQSMVMFKDLDLVFLESN